MVTQTLSLAPVSLAGVLNFERPPIIDERPTPATWADMDAVLGPIEWAWKGWLAYGQQVMIVSDSGSGKSALALRIANCFISGADWPDGTQFTGETGLVLWVECEAA